VRLGAYACSLAKAAGYPDEHCESGALCSDDDWNGLYGSHSGGEGTPTPAAQLPKDANAAMSGLCMASNANAAAAGEGPDSLPPGLKPEPTEASAQATDMHRGGTATADALHKAQSALGAMNASLTAAESSGGLTAAVAALQLAVMELQRHVLAESAARGDIRCDADAQATESQAATARMELDGGHTEPFTAGSAQRNSSGQPLRLRPALQQGHHGVSQPLPPETPGQSMADGSWVAPQHVPRRDGRHRVGARPPTQAAAMVRPRDPAPDLDMP
jgi:hypothetical protein